MLSYTEKFIRALSAYLSVKRALALWEKPLMDGYEPKLMHSREHIAEPDNARFKHRAPRRFYVWRTPPPGPKAWADKDAMFGFDVRATSPVHIERRVYRERARLRAALSGPLAETAVRRKASKPSNEFLDTWQGPPAPKDYAGTNDLLMVWPPVFLEPVPDHALRVCQTEMDTGQAGDDLKANENPAFADMASTGSLQSRKVCKNSLFSQYLWARAMFGDQGVTNFTAGLSRTEQACVEDFERQFCSPGAG